MGLGPKVGRQNAIQAAEWIGHVIRRHRIIRPLAINDEPILVPPLLDLELHRPAAIGLPLQGSGRGLPTVEGACHEHGLRLRSIKSKADALPLGVWKSFEQ